MREGVHFTVASSLPSFSYETILLCQDIVPSWSSPERRDDIYQRVFLEISQF